MGPGDTVAIVGAGPIGLAALLTAQFYSPAEIMMIDVDDNRLQVALSFGATKVVNSSDGTAVQKASRQRGRSRKASSSTSRRCGPGTSA